MFTGSSALKRAFQELPPPQAADDIYMNGQKPKQQTGLNVPRSALMAGDDIVVALSKLLKRAV